MNREEDSPEEAGAYRLRVTSAGGQRSYRLGEVSVGAGDRVAVLTRNSEWVKGTFSVADGDSWPLLLVDRSVLEVELDGAMSAEDDPSRTVVYLHPSSVLRRVHI